MRLVCKFCGEPKERNVHGYCGSCWSQLEKIESDGDISIHLDKTLESDKRNE
jgi:NMD protein affecting ribosome stability and mRNA decay